MIGCEDYRGLQLDGEDHWQGLRVVTPEVDVLYDEESCYSVIVKDNVMSIGESIRSDCRGLTSVTFPEGLTSIGECILWVHRAHLGDLSRRIDQHRMVHSLRCMQGSPR